MDFSSRPFFMRYVKKLLGATPKKYQKIHPFVDMAFLGYAQDWYPLSTI